MTDYAGESYRVASKPKDDDETTFLEPDDIDTLTVSIWTPDDTLLIDEQPMVWDAVRADFAYHFDTSGQAAGKYKIRVTITGLDARVNWEWKTLRLTADPIPA